MYEMPYHSFPSDLPLPFKAISPNLRDVTANYFIPEYHINQGIFDFSAVPQASVTVQFGRSCDSGMDVPVCPLPTPLIMACN